MPRFARAQIDYTSTYPGITRPWVNADRISLVDVQNRRVLVDGIFLEFHDVAKFAAFMAAAGLPLADIKGDTYTVAPTMFEIKTTVEAGAMTVDPVW